jgi:DNA-binding CsgD family transcriptional regulator
MNVQRNAQAAMTAVLDALSAAVFIVDERLLLIHANRAGHDMLRRGDPVQLITGKLCFPIGSDISGVTAPGRAAVYQLAARSGANSVAHVCALGGQSPGMTAIFVSAPVAEDCIAGSAAGPLYGFTPTEARIFSMIAGGLAPQGVASSLGIALGTVRTHLIKVFQKTGCRRQVELVRLGAALAMPF